MYHRNTYAFFRKLKLFLFLLFLFTGIFLTETAYTHTEKTALAAETDTSAVKLYKVTYNTTASGGTISIHINGTPVKSGGYAPYGSELTICTSPKMGYTAGRIVAAGKALSIIDGKASYTLTSDVTIQTTFRLAPISLSSGAMQFSQPKDYTYSGKKIKPAVSITYNGTYKLRSGTDYTTTYKNNKTAGKASVILQGRGLFTGKKTVTFSIKPKKMARPKVKAIGTRKLKITWKKQPGVTGYAVMVSRKKSKDYYTDQMVKGWKKTSYIRSGCSIHGKYYIKIKAYKVIKGEIVYGKESKYRYCRTLKAVTSKSSKKKNDKSSSKKKNDKKSSKK